MACLVVLFLAIVHLTDDNDGAVITSTNSFSIAENTLAGTLVGIITADDQDEGQELSFALEGTAASFFVIEPNDRGS